MNNWQEVPAWQALKALTEGTHDVERWSSTYEEWRSIENRASNFADHDHCRIRPKRRTVDAKGLPVPVYIRPHSDSKALVLGYASDEIAKDAQRILEAAREAQ